MLICGECGSRYKRVTWTSTAVKTVVWRCVSRLDNGKKYCKSSPTIEEGSLHNAIVRALNRFNDEDEQTYLTLMKATIGEAIGLNGGSDEVELLERRIDALNNRMLAIVNDSIQNGEGIENREDEFKEISEQTEQLKNRINVIRESKTDSIQNRQRIGEIEKTIDRRNQNRNIYDDFIVRQMIECIKVYPKGRLQIIFGGGYEIDEHV